MIRKAVMRFGPLASLAQSTTNDEELQKKVIQAIQGNSDFQKQLANQVASVMTEHALNCRDSACTQPMCATIKAQLRDNPALMQQYSSQHTHQQQQPDKTALAQRISAINVKLRETTSALLLAEWIPRLTDIEARVSRGEPATDPLEPTLRDAMVHAQTCPSLQGHPCTAPDANMRQNCSFLRNYWYGHWTQHRTKLQQCTLCTSAIRGLEALTAEKAKETAMLQASKRDMICGAAIE